MYLIAINARCLNAQWKESLVVSKNVKLANIPSYYIFCFVAINHSLHKILLLELNFD